MRDIRRKDRMATEEESLELLDKGEYCVLSTADENGVPYGVPLSYIRLDGIIYFHCALEGRKVDNLRANSAASLTVVGATQPVHDKSFTTYYQSVIVSGFVREVTDFDAKYRMLYAIAEKYLPDHMDKAAAAIRGSMPRTAVYALVPQSITGKAKKKKPDA